MSERNRQIEDPEVQSELNEFCSDVAERQVDAEAGKAEIWDLYPEQSAGEDGLIVILETVTGRRFTKWVRKPKPDEGLSAAFNQLFRYCGIDKKEPKKMIGQPIPIEYSRSTGDWVIDWQMIERDLAEPSDPELEAGDA